MGDSSGKPKTYTSGRLYCNTADLSPISTEEAPTTDASAGVVLTFSRAPIPGTNPPEFVLTITRSSGSWLDDNWQVGLPVTITGTGGNRSTGSGNDGVTSAITDVKPTTLTFAPMTIPFTSQTIGSPAHLFFAISPGPIVFAHNWFGDQESLPSSWLEFNTKPGSVTLIGNQMVGGARVAKFNRGALALHVAGNHLISFQEPLWFGGAPPLDSSDGVSILGNGAGGLKIVSGPLKPQAQAILAGNYSAPVNNVML